MPSLLYGDNAIYSMLLFKLSKQELGLSFTVEDYSEAKRRKIRVGCEYNKRFDAFTNDDIEDRIEIFA